MGNNDRPAYILIVIACIAIYFKCLFFGITNSDDEVLIAGNLPFLRDLSNVLKVFTTDAFYQVKSIDLYRPLQSLTYIIDAQWGGDTVFFAHLTNLVLHVFACLAVYHLLLRLDFHRRLAFAGALVYVAHYLFMTAVAWIPARGDLLLALFTFLSLLALIKSLESPAWPNLLGHLFMFTLALFSKESGVVLPLLFGIYCWTFGKINLLVKRHLLLPAYYSVAVIGYWFLKSLAVADSSDERGLIPFLKNLHLLPQMVAKFYLPLNMSTLPAYRLSTTICGILAIAFLLGLYLYCRRLQERRALFYPAWVLLFIIPGMTYYPNFYSFSNEHVDHRSYLICFGLLLANLHILQRFELEKSRYFVTAGIFFLGYLTVFNIHLSNSYRNPEEFALKAISMESNSALAFANYGAEKYMQGDELEALRYLNQSLRIVRKFMPALHYRARIFANRGMIREAVADLDTIFSVDPDYDPADYGLRGTLRARLGNNAGAEQDFLTALRLDPGLAEVRTSLGSLYFAEGRNREACTAWSEGAEQGDVSARELYGRSCR
jgi:tetratricopeptide (TPR) repeat protein